MKRIFGLAFATCLVAPFLADAQPREGIYIGVGGGLNHHQDADLEVTVLKGEVESDLGFATASSVGYAFGGPRVEAEFSYHRNETDSSTLSAAGVFHTFAGMVNFLYDIDTGTEFTPYLGAGVGGAWAEYTPTGADHVFAYQGIAGVSLNLGDNLEGFFDYHYMGTSKVENKPRQRNFEIDNRNHTAMVGLRYYFGPVGAISAPVAYNLSPPAPAPPPMLRPAAPPPPVFRAPPRAPRPQVAAAPAMRAPAERRFLVFFDFDSSRVQNDGVQIIRDAAEASLRVSVTRIDVTGHADRAGSRAYNKRLSRSRANAVKRGLISNGVPEKDIIIYARGEGDNLVPTRDGVRQPRNRRVEIVLN